MRSVLIFLSVLVTMLASLASSSAQDHLARMRGYWVNDSGINVNIEPDLLGGWKIWLPDGEGSIALGGANGGNISVASQTAACSYRATFLHDGRMLWKLTQGPGICLTGYFNRADDPPVELTDTPLDVWYNGSACALGKADFWVVYKNPDESYSGPVEFGNLSRLSPGSYVLKILPASGGKTIRTRYPYIYLIAMNEDGAAVWGGQSDDYYDKHFTFQTWAFRDPPMLNGKPNGVWNDHAGFFKQVDIKKGKIDGKDVWLLDLSCP